MNRNQIKFSVLLFGLNTFIGCGDDSPLERPTSASGTLSQEMASSFGTEFASSMGDYAESSLDGGEAIEATSGALSGNLETSRILKNQLKHTSLVSQNFIKPAVESTCTPTTSGDATDADSDSIPVSLTQSADCSISEGGFSVTIKGSLSAADKDDTDSHGGFSFEMNDFNISFDLGTQSVTSVISMNAESTKADGKHTSNFDFVSSTTQGSNQVDLGFYLDTVVTPTDSADPALYQ
jgi:hypothetical protein